MTPTAALIDWLNDDGDLVESATGGVWQDPAPENEERPVVTVSLVSSVVVRCGGGTRHIECLYAVKAVGKAADIVTVLAARDRIEQLLGAPDRVLSRESLEGFGVIGAWPEDAIEITDPEPVTGIRYEHRGAHYRLLVEAVA